jgi:hypothetical protein
MQPMAFAPTKDEDSSDVRVEQSSHEPHALTPPKVENQLRLVAYILLESFRFDTLKFIDVFGW